MELLLYIYVALLGLVVGSFLNVCILRIPKGESIVTTPSHCFTCKKPLRWWELIPVFSWLCLRGKCARCKTKISPQYPIIEATNCLLWLLVYYIHGMTLDTILGCLLTSALLVLSVIDARTREIPIQLSAFVAILGLIRFLLHIENWQSHLLGLLVVAGFLYLLLVLSHGAAIGGGDVKLMAGSGLYLGLTPNLLAFFLGCTVGSIIHIIRMRFFGAARDLAMGPYLAVGIFISMLIGDDLINWYISLLC
ncbi:MAG: prepilin peptidase [Lachnospiraceae bacterium]